MKIDWKHLASTEGYTSLKQAMVATMRSKRPDKEQAKKTFRYAISYAKKLAHSENKSIEEVLNTLEKDRNYWWVSYYSKHNLPPISLNDCVKPMGLKGLKKYFSSNNSKRLYVKNLIEYQKTQSKKKKPRWSMDKKRRLSR